MKWGEGRSPHLAGRRPGLGKHSPHPQAAVRSQSSVLRRQRRDGKWVRGRRGAEPSHVHRLAPAARGGPGREDGAGRERRERGRRPRSHSPAAGPAGGRRARTAPGPRAGHGTEDDGVAHVLDEAAVLRRTTGRTRRTVTPHVPVVRWWCSPP